MVPALQTPCQRILVANEDQLGIPIDEVDAQNVENLVRKKTGDPQNTDRLTEEGNLEIPKEYLWNSEENKENLINKLNRTQ